MIQKGIKLLTTDEVTLYSQKEIIEKLQAIGKPASAALLSRIKNGGTASVKFLTRISEGIELIINTELGRQYDFEKEAFQSLNDANWSPSKVKPAAPVAEKKGYTFHEGGRRSVAEKTAFISSARREVVFIGLRMRQFANYFKHRRDGEFADHIENLLERGVNVKCYLLDYRSNRALMYFEDIAEVFPQDAHGEQVIKEVLNRLSHVKEKLSSKGYPGKLTLHTYRHLPCAHYLIVDGADVDGKMQISHYLYGQPASKVPVLEVWRARAEKLYDLYWDAARATLSGAQLYEEAK